MKNSTAVYVKFFPNFMKSKMIRENLIQQFSILIKCTIAHNKLRDIYVFLHLVRYCESHYQGYKAYLEEYEDKKINNNALLFREIGRSSYEFLAKSQNSIIDYQIKNKGMLRFTFEYHHDNFMECYVSEEIAQITLRMRENGYFYFVQELAKNYSVASNEFSVTIDDFIGKTKTDNYKNTLKELLA